MPKHSPLAIANEFLKMHGGIGIPAQMQLQKLVYMAHGWNLAVNNESLVSDSPEAWDNGPVYRKLWEHIRDFGFGRKTHLLENIRDRVPIEESLLIGEKDVITHVWNKYKGYSGLELSKMTHEPGTPWTRTYFTKGRNAPILNDDIRAHYIQLASRAKQLEATD